MNNDMPRRARWPAPWVIALLALPLAASAQQAYTRHGLNLRAGPSNNYPVVARLGGGQPLDVVGCTRGYGWCDVALPDGMRGWLYAPGLDYVNDGNRVPLAGYGAAIGIPIVGFAVGNYWGNYYRDRPWYGERRWWGNAAPPPAYGWAPPLRRAVGYKEFMSEDGHGIGSHGKAQKAIIANTIAYAWDQSMAFNRHGDRIMWLPDAEAVAKCIISYTRHFRETGEQPLAGTANMRASGLYGPM